MKKRGQFFFMAAFVIIGIILTAGTIYNTAQAFQEETKIYDLSGELAFESYQLIDHGTFNALSFFQIQNYLLDLTNSYSKINPENEILTIYGDESNIQVVQHTNIPAGSISLESSGEMLTQQLSRKATRQPTALIFNGRQGRKVSIILDSERNISKEFDLKKGQNFFLVIKKQRGGEQIVTAR